MILQVLSFSHEFVHLLYVKACDGDEDFLKKKIMLFRYLIRDIRTKTNIQTKKDETFQ